MAFDKKYYDTEYNKLYIKRKFIPFNITVREDQEMLAHLDTVKNVTQYIKDLIRADMMNKDRSKPLPYLIIEVIDIDDKSEGHRFDKYCPTCNAGFGGFYPPKHCPRCGQLIAETGKQIDTMIIDNRTKKEES